MTAAGDGRPDAGVAHAAAVEATGRDAAGEDAGAGAPPAGSLGAPHAGAVTFEEAFAAVEAAAEASEVAIKALVATARRLKKAAQEGAIARVRREGEQLTTVLAALRDAVQEAAASWPFAESEEDAYLTERYADELRSVAAARGLNVIARDEALVCSPSIIRLVPAERALRIDGKKRSALRPSQVADKLKESQQRASGGNPQRFLEALFKAFRIVCGRQPRSTLFDSERLVTLNEIYDVFTSLPGSSLQYTRMDFARDVYLLDTSDMKTTKSGARISFHASTGARSASKTFSFVDRAGNLIPYYGIRFSGEQ